jgi:hypothetical protein
VLGWVQCLERRTLTAVALASGAVGARHISVFHRLFARAQWRLDAVGQVVFQHALRWLPAEQPVYLLGDDTLARQQGQCVSLASMHHDPLLSTARKPFFSFGHVWVVLALWVPLPMGRGRGFALPLLVRLYTGAQRGGRADAPSRPTTGQRRRVAEAAQAARDRRTKLELLRELVGLVAGWARARRFYLAVDSACAGRALVEHRPPNVEVVSRLRGDAALWAPAPKRRPGQKGRPRRRGAAVHPAAGGRPPSAVASAGGDHLRADRHHPGAAGARPVVRRPAGAAGGDRAHPRPHGPAPRRSLLLHRPDGRGAVPPGSVRPRWTLEVTFHDAKPFLAFAEPQCQTPRAVQRTAPFALLVYDLVLLWFAEHVPATTRPSWPVRPWYRHKTAPSFADMLAALRLALGPPRFLEPTRPARRPANSPATAPDRECWAA